MTSTKATGLIVTATLFVLVILATIVETSPCCDKNKFPDAQVSRANIFKTSE
jgi:hypothetical protein